MSNLVDYAKDELKKIGMIDSGEPYNDCVTKAILDLIELFASQGHSGFTAPYTVNTFSRLAMFKPLTPLTGEDDEWNELGDGSFQNKRYSTVFKDKDGTAYNIDALMEYFKHNTSQIFQRAAEKRFPDTVAKNIKENE